MNSSLHTPTTNPTSAGISPKISAFPAKVDLAVLSIDGLACAYDAAVAASDAILGIRNQPRCREDEAIGDLLDELSCALGILADDAADEMLTRRPRCSLERGVRTHVLLGDAVRVGESTQDLIELAKRLQAEAH